MGPKRTDPNGSEERRKNMNLISWNVNGIRACLKKGFEEFFKSQDADIFCLQETKMQIIEGQESKEIQEILNLPIFNNYHCYWNSAEKKDTREQQYSQKKSPYQ